MKETEMFEEAARQMMPLEFAVFEALQKMQPARDALHQIPLRDDATRKAIARRLGRALNDRDLFSAPVADDLEQLLKPFVTEIKSGWVEEVIPDEHCPEGYWINNRLTNEAETLSVAIEPLNTLLRRLRRVEHVRQAERISQRLLESRTN